jgi:glucokinase
MAARGKLGLGCDLGGTNLRAAVVDLGAGKVIRAVKRKLVDRTPAVVAAEMASAVREVAREEGLALAEIAGIGVGLAAQVLGSTGLVLVGPNLGWRDVPFGALLSNDLGRPVRIVNDLSAAAWGEAAVGAARGATDAILVFVGSGIGSGLILGGRLYEGAGGIAGEFGHTKVVPGGRTCGCGEVGCLEAYVGGNNFGERLRELVREGRAQGVLRAAGGDPAQITVSSLDVAAEGGDEEALILREEAARLLGIATGNVITLLNPAKLILGGGVLNGAPGLKREAVEWIRRTAGRAHLAQVHIVDAALGDDAGGVGAALLGALPAA